jgi:hypothetical protein
MLGALRGRSDPADLHGNNEYGHMMIAWELAESAWRSGGFGDTQGLEDRCVQLQGNRVFAMFMPCYAFLCNSRIHTWHLRWTIILGLHNTLSGHQQASSLSLARSRPASFASATLDM